MPIVGIREVDVGDWSPSSDTIGESITVEAVDHRTQEKLFSGWKFSNQDVISLSFEYVPTDGFGSVVPVKGSIEVRPDSGLLLVICDEDVEKVDQVIREFRKAVGDGIKVKKRFVIGREKIWRFLSSGEPVRFDVVTPFGGVQRVSLDNLSNQRSGVTLDDARNNYPIDIAKIKFSNDGREFSVRYFEDKLDIKTDEETDIEYVIQILESAISN